MELSKIKAFFYAAQSKSFTGTRLALSASVINRHVQDLEHYLGVLLFYRTPKGLVLTKSGKILFKEAEDILTRIKELEENIKSHNSNPQEVLNIYIPTQWISDIVMSHISKFIDSYPNVTVNIIIDDSLPNFHDLEVCNVALTPYTPEDSKLIRRVLTSYSLGLFASRHYIKKFGIPKTKDCLKNHRLIGSSGRSGDLCNLDWHLRLNPNEQISPYLRVNNMYNAAKNSIGIASLAKENKIMEKDNEMVQILPELKGPEGKAFFIYSEHLKNSKPVKNFADYISELIGKNLL